MREMPAGVTLANNSRDARDNSADVRVSFATEEFQEGSTDRLWMAWKEPSKSARMSASRWRIYDTPETGLMAEDPMESFWVWRRSVRVPNQVDSEVGDQRCTRPGFAYTRTGFETSAQTGKKRENIHFSLVVVPTLMRSRLVYQLRTRVLELRI